MKALMIDDDAYLLEISKQMFEFLDHELDTCDSGIEGLNKFKNFKYDFVIVDINMSGLAGERLIEELKKIDPSAFIFICTGYGNSYDISNSKCNGLIPKPFTISDLSKILSGIETFIEKK